MEPPPGGSVEVHVAPWLEDGRYPLDWNGPTGRPFTPFGDGGLDQPVIEHFERVVRRYPGRTALTDSDTSLSYAELWDGVSGLADTIAARSRPGDLIGIALPACAMGPLAMLACLAAGRPFVTLDPDYPESWFDQVPGDARPALILRRPDVPRVPPPASHIWRPTALGVDEPACVVFTSGSTGRPKGILNSQRNLLQRVAQSINAAHITAEDRFLTLASPGSIVGVRDAITALLAGARVHILDPQRAGAREIADVVRAEAITILFAFPAFLRSMIPGGGERAPDALRLVRIGGDTTLWSDVDRLRGWLASDASIQLIFAATEAPMMQWFVDDSRRTHDPRVPIGYPLPGNRLALIDEGGRPTPAGEVGELVVESSYVALGLGGVFRTGDLVRQRPDGLLERMGRKDRQIKIRGTRVDLDGVEAALRGHPLVCDVGALARPAGGTTNADGTVTLVAYVSPRDGEHAGLLDELKDMMRSAPPHMRPARLYLIHEIPRLPSSKLDLRALLALDDAKAQEERATRAAAAARTRRADRDDIARTVARIWQEVLETPVTGPEDDFFEAGGDSLKAVTFMIALEHALDAELSLTMITEAPTFAGLCDALRERDTRYVPLVLLKAGDDRLPPVFIVHGVGGSVAGLFPMTRRMTCAGPVIGIQARGLDGRESPHATVEAMAAEYVRAVKARQPEGPYHLCGYSFGGLVAFEMARRLRESGDEVGLLGLLDTRMSPQRQPLRAWLSLIRGRLMQFAAGAIAAPVDSWRDLLKSAPTSVLKVAASAIKASSQYRPGFYPGELTLFMPVRRAHGLPPLEAIWRAHARTLSVVETAGAHSTMFSAAHAESTAASLTRCVLTYAGYGG